MKYLILLTIVAFSHNSFCQTTVNVVQNGSFENDLASWTYDAHWGWFTANPCVGSVYALTGDASGNGVNVLDDRLEQYVTIPAGATSATLSFCYKTLSDNPNSATSGDFMAVYFNGNQVGGSIYPQPSSSYVTASIPISVSGLGGQSVLLEFFAWGVNDAYWSKFYLDNVILNVTYTACNSFSASSPSTIPSSGGNGQSSISAGSSCSWTATSSCGWLTLNNSSGTGNGTVTFTAGQNCGSSLACTVNITSGGSTVASFTVNQSGSSSPSSPSVGASPTSICSSGQTSNLTITNQCSGCNYSWSSGCNPQTGTSTSVTTPGTYYATVTDACNNTASGSVTVQQNSQSFTPSLQANPTSICPTGSSSTISVTNSGSCTNCTYAWSGGSPSGSTTSVPAPNNYSVTVTNGCTQTSTASISVGNSNFNLQTPQVTANPNTACANQTSTITITNSTAYSGCTLCTYSWSSGTGSNTSHTETGPGTYVVTITNSCNQSVSGQATVNNSATPPATPTLQATPPSFCTGTATIQVTNTSGCSQCTYAWSSGCSPQSGSNTSVSTAGTYSVTVTNGCSLTATNSITLNSNPTASITPTNPSFCPGSNTQITATQGTQYNWSNGMTQQSITITSAGIYTVTVTNPGGCTGTASGSATATIYVAPNANAGSNQTVSLGSSITLGGNPTAFGGSTPYSYNWSGNVSNQTIANPTATINDSATYCVTVTDAHTCTASNCVLIDTGNCNTSTTLNHSSETFGPQGGLDTILVNGQANCAWSTSNALSWVNIISGLSGSGTNPPVKYSVGTCPDNNDRSGTIMVAGQAFSVTQHCQCNAPNSITISIAGGILDAEYIAGATYQWSLNGIPIVGATSRFYTCPNSCTGIYTIEVCMGAGCCSQTDTVLTAIKDVILDREIKLFPNPTSGIIYLLGDNLPEQELKVKLCDNLGRVLKNYNYDVINGQIKTTIDVTLLPAGIYFLEIISAKGVAVKEIDLEK